jgi:STE24 endopeptidase
VNIFGFIILFTLLLEFTLQLIADKLNIGTLREMLPREFVGVYDEETYKKSQVYTKTKTLFGIVTSSISLAIAARFGRDYDIG